MSDVMEVERPAEVDLELDLDLDSASTAHQPIPKKPTMEMVRDMIDRSQAVITALQQAVINNDVRGKEPKLFSITQAGKLLGKTPQTIRVGEEKGIFPDPKKTANGRRVGYTLADINSMREHYGYSVGRSETERPVIMSFQNFKGGVGKTTLTCHFAQYLALKGYRVLLIDADSQASATTMFGYQPDIDIDPDHTLYPYLAGEQEDLSYAIRETHWDKLHLLPANLDLYAAEYHLSAVAGNNDNNGAWIDMLSMGIATIEHNYDVILIDSPPALGMISLNVLKAISGLVVPVPASMMDFHSTATFIRMLNEVLESIAKNYGDESIEFDFFKFLISKHDASSGPEKFVAQLTSSQFEGHMMQRYFVDSAEIGNAASRWKTVYELEQPSGSPRTYKRCVDSMDAVFAEVEHNIQKTWPSHDKALRGTEVAFS